MKINALCTASPQQANRHCDTMWFCGDKSLVNDIDNTVLIVPFDGQVSSGNIYVPSLVGDDVVETICDYLLDTDSKAIIRAAYDLTEAGIIEAKYKLSPIMLLHKMSVLNRCIIAGGVCLDNDDLDLMAQEGIPLVITPTASAGYGHGYAPVCAALRRGLRVGLGTFDGKYNPEHDLDYEVKFLALTANAEMRTENVLTTEQINKILSFSR